MCRPYPWRIRGASAVGHDPQVEVLAMMKDGPGKRGDPGNGVQCSTNAATAATSVRALGVVPSKGAPLGCAPRSGASAVDAENQMHDGTCHKTLSR